MKVKTGVDEYARLVPTVGSFVAFTRICVDFRHTETFPIDIIPRKRNVFD